MQTAWSKNSKVLAHAMETGAFSNQVLKVFKGMKHRMSKLSLSYATLAQFSDIEFDIVAILKYFKTHELQMRRLPSGYDYELIGNLRVLTKGQTKMEEHYEEVIHFPFLRAKVPFFSKVKVAYLKQNREVEVRMVEGAEAIYYQKIRAALDGTAVVNPNRKILELSIRPGFEWLYPKLSKQIDSISQEFANYKPRTLSQVEQEAAAEFKFWSLKSVNQVLAEENETYKNLLSLIEKDMKWMQSLSKNEFEELTPKVEEDERAFAFETVQGLDMG